MNHFRFLLITGILCLTGCNGTMPIAPPVQVDKVVVKKCTFDKVDDPLTPFGDLAPTVTNVYTIVQSAIAEIENRKGYETQLKGAIAGCDANLTDTSTATPVKAQGGP